MQGLRELQAKLANLILAVQSTSDMPSIEGGDVPTQMNMQPPAPAWGGPPATSPSNPYSSPSGSGSGGGGGQTGTWGGGSDQWSGRGSGTSPSSNTGWNSTSPSWDSGGGAWGGASTWNI